MIRDTPSWNLPPGTGYDFLNFVFDTGVPRQRQGSTALVSGAQTAFLTSLGWVYSADATPIEELYGMDGKTGTAYSISKTTGAGTSLGVVSATNSIVGRPARHFGFVVFPTGFSRSVIMCGQTNSTTFTSAGTTVITANNPQIALGGPDTTASVRVGMYVHAVTAATAYAGRIVSIDSGSLFTVWPVPTISLSPTAASFTGRPAFGLGNTNGGVCCTSFQNRLLFGQSFDMAANKATSAITRADRRINYGVLPTETGINVTQVYSGASGFLFAPSWPVLNYIEVPGSDPIIAMEPVSDNQLLVLTNTHPVVVSGDLVTQLGDTSPTITFDVSDINVNASCLSDLSVQRTPRGIVWAGAGGIYAWDGRQPVDITTDAVNTFWRAQVRGSSFAVHGAVYVRGYYMLSYSSGGTTQALIADLTGKQPKWGRANGVGTDNFYGTARPTDPSQVFAIRWWDQTGAAPSMTNGQTLRLESMLNPYVSGTTTDADGSAVTISATTRTITGDPERQKVFQRATVRHQQSSTTAAVAVTAQSKIDAADISAASVRSLGSLSNTSVLTVSNATNANPIVVTTSTNHGLQSDDFVDIDGVTGNTNANGRYRIAVTGAATFTLVGGIGNGAFGGSPTCKKLTETDYQISTLNAGQGVSYKFDGAPNNFELHGITTAVLQKQPVMST